MDQSLDIAFFSSRGPSACDGSIFPEVVAPGVNVRTSDLTLGGIFPDSYVTVSGTSFSAPHVAGAIALLLSAFPDLTVSELELALKQSAFDLGTIGADSDYGYGLIDVMQAYDLLLNPTAKISISPSSHQFAKTKEGRSSSPQIFTLTNRGLRDLIVDTLSTAGSNASEFKAESDGCSGQIVAPMETCTMEVVFAPSSGGMKSGSLSIPSNDPYQNPAMVTLTGKGIEQYNLQVVTEGTGRVKSTPAGIDCGGECTQLFSPGAMVTLEATPGPDSAFGGWSSCSSSSGRTCQVFMGRDKTVTAKFVGPNITVTAPNGEEAWKRGTYQKIKWTYTGKPGGYVRIELLDGEVVLKTIAEKVSRGENGLGRYSWFVPKSLAAGQGYKVRITSTRNGTYTDVSDDPFSIGP